MSPDAKTLDPQLEEVLGDIARDPKARLFMVDPRRLVTGLRAIGGQVSISRAGLRPAERELLRVHREEVASLLIEEARRLRRRDEDSWLVDPRPTKASEVVVAESRAHLADAWPAPDAPAVRDLLERLARAGPSHGVGRLALVLAALDLVDRPAYRVHLALEYGGASRPRMALATAGEVLASTSSVRVRSSAQQCVATALYVLNREQAAYEHFRAAALDTAVAADFPDGSAVALGNLLVAEVERASTAGVLEVDRILRDRGLDGNEFLTALRDNVARERRHGLRFTPDGCAAARDALPRVGTSCRDLLAVILE
jgi:hypothetical protein